MGRSIYFIKTADKLIAANKDEPLEAAMSRSVEYAVLPGPSLVMLERLIQHVYLPLFDSESPLPPPVRSTTDNQTEEKNIERCVIYYVKSLE
jgi:hypothetical protein